MRILIAEDDLVSRRLLEAMLVKRGYNVVVACDGAEAWQALQREDTPKLAILDWMMPEMSGLEVLKRMREIPSLAKIPVILLTAKTEDEDLLSG